MRNDRQLCSDHSAPTILHILKLYSTTDYNVPSVVTKLELQFFKYYLSDKRNVENLHKFVIYSLQCLVHTYML
ncbi:hypothetical protein KPH14_009922 [Odynerus spinipes]|uniref:Uncharacterized protein n=1 Tax=Odynerus spinipes TaxID=1348599 RepID=A0AAD9RSM6_9HYME|nr:hypothetical protein KPH14_009922 [Odynerus spinipes]